MMSSVGYFFPGVYDAGFTMSPFTTVPSLLFDVKSSVVASWSCASRSSFTFVSVRSVPPSSACTSGVWRVDPASSVSLPSAPSDTFDTVPRPVVSFSTAPPAVVVRPTYSTRSSPTAKVSVFPSGDHQMGPETGRSRASVRTFAAPPDDGMTVSLLIS